MVIGAVSLFTGILLGQYFKVLAIVPAAALALALGIGLGIAHGEPLAWIAWTGVSAIVGLQLGYLIGVLVPILATGPANWEARSFSTSPPPSRRPGVHYSK